MTARRAPMGGLHNWHMSQLGTAFGLGVGIGVGTGLDIGLLTLG